MKKSGNRIKSIVIIALCIMLAGCSGIFTQLPTQQPETEKSEPAATTQQPESVETSQPPAAAESPTGQAEVTPTPTEAPAPVEINIMAVGDIMFHAPIIAAGKEPGTSSYNFDYNFQYIKDIISSADLALGNFECTLAGPGRPYSEAGGKSFSAPDEAADAIRNAGFDVVCTANNHAYDRKDTGLLRTVQVMREKGLICIGTREEESEKPYSIVDVKGIKVGMTAYTYGARPGGTGVALNGLTLSKDTRNLVNVFQPSSATAELARMTQVVEDMRADGADVVLFFMHWGTEDQRTPNSVQKKLAQGLADAGVDIIFASHPHVLQTVDVIHSEKTGKQTVVVYSLGNFISNQRSEYEPRWIYTEDGMITSVKVTKHFDSGITEVSALEYLPTWTFMYTSGGLHHYTVVPLDKALASPSDFGITLKRDVNKAQKSYDHTQELLKDAVDNGELSMMGMDK